MQVFTQLFSAFFIPVPSSDFWRDSLHQKHQFRPSHATEPNALTQENARMEPALFESFVVHYISAILPMQDFHNFAGTADKNINVAVRGIKADHPYLTTQTVHTHAHISRMLRHDNTVAFIQIKHSVFDCEVRNQKRYMKAGLFRTDTHKTTRPE